MKAQKIVIGVCGIGNGHSARQLPIIRELAGRGHGIVVLTYGQGTAILTKALKGLPLEVPVIEVQNPWVDTGSSGVDVELSGSRLSNMGPKTDPWNFAICAKVSNALNGNPTLVISDYESVSAQIAYMTGCRLVTIDQQSKYLMFDTPDMNGITRWKEASRLRYFFPYADERIATSFFEMRWPRDTRFAGQIVPPIIRQDLFSRGASEDPGQVVVYVSPYGPMQQKIDELIGILNREPSIKFKVFASSPFSTNMDNVTIYPFDENHFTSSIMAASGVIGTAGHQLLSECLYLNKPVLVIPFQNYEQIFNAIEVRRLGFGLSTRTLDVDVLQHFLDCRDLFANCAGEQSASLYGVDVVSQILDSLEI